MTSAIPSARQSRIALYLLLLFLLALVPRLYSAQTVGWHWDFPGSFTLVNFDEGGSCRAALKGFDYSPLIGRQTIAIATALDAAPPPGIIGNHAAVKAYCHSADHILVARTYSAVTGALTAVLVVFIGLMLVPARPGVAWTAGWLVALSGFHISESHSGTVDAPSVFFIYLFLTVLIYAVSRPSRFALYSSPVLLAVAVGTKYWVFAVFAYCAYLPARVFAYLTADMTATRLIVIAVATSVLLGALSNSDFPVAAYPALAAVWYLLIPWRRMPPMALPVWLAVPVVVYGFCQIDLVAAYTTSGMEGRFGTGYAAIGWHKWLRNLLNVPVVLLVGIGLPAFLFIPAGLRFIARTQVNAKAWCCLLPLLVFALYMAFVTPITYYRHYLPLIPVAAIVAACGLYATRWSSRRWFMALFLVWPALLALDVELDYHKDPRIALRQWYAQHPGARVFASFYVNPPAAGARLFKPEYAAGDAEALRQAQYLLLSENWYDTAFANELNGPLVNDPARLIKTRPQYVDFYRAALSGAHPHLVPEAPIELHNFMPELLLHRALYGTFQLFVGDIRIFRVVQ